MENTKLKNKIAPWQERGRWYKIELHCELVSGSTYTFVIDSYDDIFSTSDTTGKIYLSVSTSNLIMKNNTGVQHSIPEIRRVVTGTDPNATTAAISSGVISAFLPNSTATTNISFGFTAAVANINKKFTMWFFID